MTGIVALLVLASAALHASWNAVVKGRSGDPLAASLGLTAVWALLAAPALLLVAPPAPESWLPLAASIAIHLVYLGLLIAAYRSGDLSLVYTIARGVPPILVTFAASVFVGERLTPLGLAGVVAIATGVFALHHAPGGEQADAARTRRRATVLALATAACIASYTVVDGVGARASQNALSYWVWLIAGEGLLFAIAAAAYGGRPVVREAAARWRTALATGVMSAAGYGIALWAMTEAPIALVAALRETAVLFAAILGAIVLREPFGPRRVVAATLVAAGSVCIRFAG